MSTDPIRHELRRTLCGPINPHHKPLGLPHGDEGEEATSGLGAPIIIQNLGAVQHGGAAELALGEAEAGQDEGRLGHAEGVVVVKALVARPLVGRQEEVAAKVRARRALPRAEGLAEEGGGVVV